MNNVDLSTREILPGMRFVEQSGKNRQVRIVRTDLSRSVAAVIEDGPRMGAELRIYRKHLSDSERWKSRGEVARDLGSVLTNYYGSRHREVGQLRTLYDLRLDSDLVVDSAIVVPQHDGPGRLVALYEVADPRHLTMANFEMIDALRTYARRPCALGSMSRPVEIGLVLATQRERGPFPYDVKLVMY